MKRGKEKNQSIGKRAGYPGRGCRQDSRVPRQEAQEAGCCTNTK